MKFQEMNVPANYVLSMAAKGVVQVKMFELVGDNGKDTGIRVVTSIDGMFGKEDLKEGTIHMTVFHEDRYPSIREIFLCKQSFFNEIEMALYFPPGVVIANSHHLWEVKQAVNDSKIISNG